MDTASSDRTALFVHGLWMSGHESVWVRRRMARVGIQLRRFQYASLREDPAVPARRLGDHLAADPDCHLVAHSFGGLIALAAVAGVPQWTGRAVLLGAPVAGSASARRLRRIPGGALLLGAARAWLTAPPPVHVPNERIAVIAGLRNVGVGRMFGACPAPADGVVRLAETRIDGAAAIVVRTCHVGLLFDRRAVDAAAAFLVSGRLGV